MKKIVLGLKDCGIKKSKVIKFFVKYIANTKAN